MASFKDGGGRVWQVALTIGDLPKLKALGFDLADIKAESVHRILYADPLALVDVLWVLVNGQYDVARDDFMASADSAVLDDASAALDEALVDFFLRRPLRSARTAADASPPASTSPSGDSPASPG